MISRHKVATANKVLSKISSLSKGLKLTLEMYSNGREQGYSLLDSEGVWPMKKVAFSESRTTDKVVVLCGTANDFDMQGNIPSDSVYKNRKLFLPTEIDKAAQFIIDYLSSDTKK